jgi:hypothetical protein
LLLRTVRNNVGGVNPLLPVHSPVDLPADLRQAATAELDVCLKPLFQAIPGAADELLDLRAAWCAGLQPGACVRMYFALQARVPGWRRGELRPLRDLLEAKIRLWIVIRESEMRRSACLGLARAESLEDYCEQVMREAARRDAGAARLDLSFAWAG